MSKPIQSQITSSISSLAATASADAQQDSVVKFMETLTPKKIVEYLDKYIVGQEDAKRSIAIGIRNRYRRLKLPQEVRDEIVPKNIMMIGPTGVGKTEIARRIAKLLSAPFIKVEATKYTEVGYVGRDVESMVRDLMASSISIVKKEITNSNKSQIAKRVEERLFEEVFKRKEELKLNTLTEDEIKRMLKRGDFDNKEIEIETKPANVLGDMFQGMGIIGIEANVPPDLGKMFAGGKKKTKKVKITQARTIFNQEESDKVANDETLSEVARWRAEQLGIIFIDEFDKIVNNQSKGSESVSREGVQRDILPIVEGSQVQTRYGIVDTTSVLFIAAGAFHVCKPSDLIPELQGRFPIRVELQELTVEDFVNILSQTERSLISQYTNLLATEGILVEVADQAIAYIADMAYQMNNKAENIGARRLYTVMEKLFETIMFEAPETENKNVIIDIAYVKAHLDDISNNQEHYRYIL